VACAAAAALVLAASPVQAEDSPASVESARLEAVAAAPPVTGTPRELFDPVRYVGRWYEVASLKKGFAGEGQQDCHCTQVRIDMELVPH
jgi:lipocalin